MNKRRAFSPSSFEQLEERLVLSHFPSRGLSIVARGLTPRQQVINQHQQPVVAEVTQAFNSFQSDYGQARATYFASILNQQAGTSAATSAAKAFTLYTAQRVELLAQQLTSSFLQESAGTARTNGKDVSLKLLVETKIINPNGKNGPTGLLYQSLVSTIPPAGSSAPTESLYILSQNNAIQTALDTVVNAVGILRNGDFGNTTNS